MKRSREFKTGPIRFTSLKWYANPVNDYWESPKGQGLKVFPHSIFVGQAVEGVRLVSYFWECDEMKDFAPSQTLKTFRASTRNLGGLGHGETGPYSFFVEHAKVGWLAKSDRPKSAPVGARVERRWSYRNGKFVAGGWKVSGVLARLRRR